MPKSCIICSAVASPDLQLEYCAACQSALYCSRACQRKDWKAQHKQICKRLNVGHGDRQVRTDYHTGLNVTLKEQFEAVECLLDEDGKRFFKLFEESTFEGSRAAARKMKKIAKRQTKQKQKLLLFHGLRFLVLSSNSEMLSWPNSPLLVMLQFVDPNVLNGDEDTPMEQGAMRITTLYFLANLADPFDYSTHENQLILAKQLIERGANVNTVCIPQRETPLHKACSWSVVTNLDFVELLLEAGADPNAQDHMGTTPLMYTIPDAPGAAKFLLNWPTTDANITTRSGEATFSGRVRKNVEYFSNNPNWVHHQFQLQQWREIEEMLAKTRGAHTTGITAHL
jgi:hypothetical protein